MHSLLQPWFLCVITILMLIGFVMTLAINAKHGWVHKLNGFLGIVLLGLFGLTMWAQFVLYPWHISWTSIPQHIIVLIVSLVFLFGGGLIVSDDVDPQSGVIIVNSNSFTHKVMKKFSINADGTSLCDASWTTILSLIFMPVFWTIATLFKYIVFVCQFLISGASIKDMWSDITDCDQYVADWRFPFWKGFIPQSPLVWTAIVFLAWAAWAIHSNLYFQIVLLSIAFAAVLSYLMINLIDGLHDQHKSMQVYDREIGYTYKKAEKFAVDPIGYTGTLMSTLHGMICPKLEIREPSKVVAPTSESEPDAPKPEITNMASKMRQTHKNRISQKRRQLKARR